MALALAPLHVGIAGPIATDDVAPLLDASRGLPRGYSGAPLMATLIGELLARGHRVSAFTLSGDLPLRLDAAVVARGPGLTLHYIPLRPRAWPFNGWRPGRILDLYRFERAGLRRAITSVRPDVVHAHWSYEFAWAALASGCPHVVTCHDSPLVIARLQRGFRYAGYRWLRALMALHVLRHARCVTSVSPYMIEQVQPLCRTPVALVPNPVDGAALRQRWTGSPSGRRVLMVGNGFGARKNAAAGLQAFALLARSGPGWELHAFGDDFGPGQQAQRWWRAHQLEGTAVFHGRVPHDEVLRAMAASDVLLHPALEESFGAVLAEALAVGLPVVAGERSGAIPWVLGDAGVLVDVTSPAAMAAGIRQVVDHAAPREGALARREGVLQRFGASIVAGAYEGLYRDALCAQRGGASP